MNYDNKELMIFCLLGGRRLGRVAEIFSDSLVLSEKGGGGDVNWWREGESWLRNGFCCCAFFYAGILGY